MMRTLFATGCLAGIVIAGAAAAPAYAGPPGASCQGTVNPSTGLLATPGHSASSPGSPFNEAGFPPLNSATGGIGGQHYSPKSQYDVACANQLAHVASTAAPQPAASTGAPGTPASTAPATTVKTGHTPHHG
jgi:hypothetical protein